MSDDLKVIFPGRDVQTRIGVINVSPFRSRKFPAALALLSEIAPKIAQAKEFEGVKAILKAIELGGEPVYQLMALALGKPVEIFDELLLDDTMALFTAVVEENYDFFTQKVIPMVVALTDSIQKIAPQEKQGSSQSTSD